MSGHMASASRRSWRVGAHVVDASILSLATDVPAASIFRAARTVRLFHRINSGSPDPRGEASSTPSKSSQAACGAADAEPRDVQTNLDHVGRITRINGVSRWQRGKKFLQDRWDIGPEPEAALPVSSPAP